MQAVTLQLPDAVCFSWFSPIKRLESLHCKCEHLSTIPEAEHSMLFDQTSKDKVLEINLNLKLISKYMYMMIDFWYWLPEISRTAATFDAVVSS